MSERDRESCDVAEAKGALDTLSANDPAQLGNNQARTRSSVVLSRVCRITPAAQDTTEDHGCQRR